VDTNECAGIKDSCFSGDALNIVMSGHEQDLLGDNDPSKIRTRIWRFLCRKTRPFRKKKIDSFDVLHPVSGSTQSLPVTATERIANSAPKLKDHNLSGHGPFLSHSRGVVSTNNDNASKFIHSRRNARSRCVSVP